MSDFISSLPSEAMDQGGLDSLLYVEVDGLSFPRSAWE